MASPNRSLEWIKRHKDYKSDKCLEWPFSRNADGYGKARTSDGKCGDAHRIMCMEAHGALFSGSHHAAHTCGNHGCVNPRHLYWASPSQNQFDISRHSRGRRKGRGNPALNREKAERIRTAYRQGAKQVHLAQEFGVSPRTIRFVLNGETWK